MSSAVVFGGRLGAGRGGGGAAEKCKMLQVPSRSIPPLTHHISCALIHCCLRGTPGYSGAFLTHSPIAIHLSTCPHPQPSGDGLLPFGHQSCMSNDIHSLSHRLTRSYSSTHSLLKSRHSPPPFTSPLVSLSLPLNFTRAFSLLAFVYHDIIALLSPRDISSPLLPLFPLISPSSSLVPCYLTAVTQGEESVCL